MISSVFHAKYLMNSLLSQNYYLYFVNIAQFYVLLVQFDFFLFVGNLNCNLYVFANCFRLFDVFDDKKNHYWIVELFNNVYHY